MRALRGSRDLKSVVCAVQWSCVGKTARTSAASVMASVDHHHLHESLFHVNPKALSVQCCGVMRASQVGRHAFVMSICDHALVISNTYMGPLGRFI